MENEEAKTFDKLTDESVVPRIGTTTGTKQVTADQPTAPKFFPNTEEWSKDFITRFDRAIVNFPTQTYCSKAAANLITANRLINEIKNFNARKEIFLRNNDYRSVSFMGNQEGRLNQLGLFLYPVTWGAVRCGAGVLTNDCGQPWPTSSFPKTGP